MQFRQQALAKLRSPEELDLPVRFARPQGWLVLSVTVVAMAAASVWAVTGTVASTVGAPAVLTYAEGSYILQSPVAGQVTAVLAKEGERLPVNAPVLKVRTAQGRSAVVRTIAAGRVTALAATIGAIIPTGANVAAVEKVAHSDDPLYATVYVPAASAATIPAGAAVDLAVQSVPWPSSTGCCADMCGRWAGARRPGSRSPPTWATANWASSSPGRAGRWPSWSGSTVRPAPGAA